MKRSSCRIYNSKQNTPTIHKAYYTNLSQEVPHSKATQLPNPRSKIEMRDERHEAQSFVLPVCSARLKTRQFLSENQTRYQVFNKDSEEKTGSGTFRNLLIVVEPI
eukprot:2697553-Amphidinium_carterae.1